MTKKLGHSSVGNKEIHHCLFCGNKDFESVSKLCGECKAVRKHWGSHSKVYARQYLA